MRSRLALGLAVVLAACSGGGSGGGSSVPSLPWGNFRHDNSNSAASGAIDRNTGKVTLLSVLDGMTLSTPTIDHDDNLLIGTANGVVSLDSDGTVRWTFQNFETATPSAHQSGCSPCTPGPEAPTCMAVGSVSSSPSVTPGNTIVFGSDAAGDHPGYLFAIQDRGTTVDCNWVLRPADGVPASGIRSSAAVEIDSFDLSLQSVFIGGDDGRLLAVNSDGTVRWSVPAGAAADAITATPAVDLTNTIYIASRDGILSAVDSAGRLSWRFPIGVPPAAPFHPSPAVGTTVYAIGNGGAVFGVNPNGTQKWLYTPPIPISGSPAFLIQTLDQGAVIVTDTIVYVVDQQGTAYGLRDQNGTIVQLQRCSSNPDNPNQGCQLDSCPPPLICSAATNRCGEGTAMSDHLQPGDSEGATVNPTPTPGEGCTLDSCQPDRGMCTLQNGTVSVTGPPVPITTSPVVSGDLFAVVGTSDGRVCARALDGTVPGQDLNPPTAAWAGRCNVTTSQTCYVNADCPTDETCVGHCNVTTSQTCSVSADCPADEICVPVGCIAVGDGGPTRSSPIIGENGTIYVTRACRAGQTCTDAGLYVIK